MIPEGAFDWSSHAKNYNQFVADYKPAGDDGEFRIRLMMLFRDVLKLSVEPLVENIERRSAAIEARILLKKEGAL